VGWKMGTKFGLEDFRFVAVKTVEEAQHHENQGTNTDTEVRQRTESQVTDLGAKCSSVQCTVCIEGWVPGDDEIHDSASPFRGVETHIFANSDVFAVAWEPTILGRVGRTLTEFQASGVESVGLVEHNPGMIARVWKGKKREVPPKVDRRWKEAMDQVEEAGKAMAAAITDAEVAGRRPITLVGFSLGAAVIFHALQELYKTGKFHAVQSVVLMGAPALMHWTAPDGEAEADVSQWTKARAVVSDRFVNCYSKNDWVLGVFMRKMDWSEQVAGLSPINIEGVENVDCSDLIVRHTDYATKVRQILELAEAFR